MKHEPGSTRPTSGEQHARRRQLQTRFSSLRRGGSTVRPGVALGAPELLAIAASLVLLLTAIAAYVLMLAPERARRERLLLERAQLQAKLRDAADASDRSLSVGASVQNILQSLESFESGTLSTRAASSTGVIEELNDKTRRNGLTRAQFSFTHQDESTPGAPLRASSDGNGNRRQQSLYPSIDIGLIIEGPYGNLRRFIRDLEASRSFIVINSVQLEGVNETGAATGGGARGVRVSLRLNMSAYFRRGATLADAGGNVTLTGASQ